MNTTLKVALFLVLIAGVGAAVFLLSDRGAPPAPPAVEGDAGAESPAAQQAEALVSENQALEPVAAAKAGRTEVSTATVTPTSSESGIALTGRLVLPGGGPAAGVPVGFTTHFNIDDMDDPGAIRRLRRAGGGRIADLPAGARVETDAGGRFRIEVPQQRSGQLKMFDPADYLFESGKGSYPVPATTADLDLGDLLLTAGASLAGYVRDPSGRPVEGVEVRLTRPVGVTGALGALGPARVESDRDGRFIMRRLTAGEYTLVTASARHLPARVSVSLAEAERRDGVEVVLELGGSIWGRVVNDLGQPIAGASVGAYRARSESGVTIRGLSRGESVETDADGRFELGGLETGPVTVRASHEDHMSARHAGVMAGASDLSLVLKRRGGVEGRLVDTEGAPIVGSDVEARPVGDEPMMMIGAGTGAKTDADGVFRIEGVAPGEVEVVARGGHVAAAERVTVAMGEFTRGVRIVATRGASIAVRVLDPDGQPVQGVQVAVVEGDPSSAAPSQGQSFQVRRRVERRVGSGDSSVFIDDGSAQVLGEDTTDEEGRAQIGGLEAGRVTVTTEHDVWAPAVPRGVDVRSDGEQEVELRVRAAGVAVLRVVDADGAPLVGRQVDVRAAGADPSNRTAKTDDEGMARLTALPPGTYSAALKRENRPVSFGSMSVAMVAGLGDSVLESTRAPFQVRVGETVELTLTEPIMARVTGTLRDASGPVAGGRVALQSAGEDASPIIGLGSPYSARTDKDGGFVIEDVPDGSYEISYRRDDQPIPMREELLLQGQREVHRDLVLAGGEVRVTVTDSDGDPLRRADVRIESDSQRSGTPRRTRSISMVSFSAGGAGESSVEMRTGDPVVKTDEDGVARIRDVPPGTYTVRVSHGRHITHTVRDVEVAREQVRDLGSVQLRAGGSISGTVVGADGAPPMVANVRLEGVDGSSDSAVALQGAFRFNGVAPGRYTLKASDPRGGEVVWGPTQEVEVRAGRVARVKLGLE